MAREISLAINLVPTRTDSSALAWQSEVWKFDSALESAIRKTLKQAAIEEGQWTEKR